MATALCHLIDGFDQSGKRGTGQIVTQMGHSAESSE